MGQREFPVVVHSHFIILRLLLILDNVVDNKTSTEFNSTTADDYYQVQDTTLHVNCLDKSSEVEWECQTLECTVTDISSYVEIHFDMSFVQKSIGINMESY